MATESVVDLKRDDSVDSVVVSWFPQRTVSLTLRHCSCSCRAANAWRFSTLWSDWRWQWVHRTSSYMELSTCVSGGAHRTDASCELRKPPLVYDAPSSVWRLVCDQAGVVKLTDDIKQAVAVFSDCKRQGLWLRGSIPVVLFWRLVCNRLELSRRLVAVCRGCCDQ